MPPQKVLDALLPWQDDVGAPAKLLGALADQVVTHVRAAQSQSRIGVLLLLRIQR